MQWRPIHSDRQSLRCAVKRKIANNSTENVPNLYPHHALNRANTVISGQDKNTSACLFHLYITPSIYTTKHQVLQRGSHFCKIKQWQVAMKIVFQYIYSESLYHPPCTTRALPPKIVHLITITYIRDIYYRQTCIWQTQWDQEKWSVICKLCHIHITHTWYVWDWDQAYHLS